MLAAQWPIWAASRHRSESLPCVPAVGCNKRNRPQRVDIARQKAASPVQQIDGEEPASAGPGTAIIRRGGNDRKDIGLTPLSRRRGAMRCACCTLRLAGKAAVAADMLRRPPVTQLAH